MTDVSSLGQAVTQVVTEQAGGTTAECSASDVSKFQSAMGQQEQAPAAGSHVEAQSVQAVEGAASAAQSPGHRILDALGDYQKQGTALAESLANSPDSPAEMLKIQMQVMQHSAQTELLSKVVGSANKTVETLLKSG